MPRPRHNRLEVVRVASRQKLNAKTIRGMKPEDRAKLLNDLRNELLRLQTQRERGTLENPGRVRAVKRAIAGY